MVMVLSSTVLGVDAHPITVGVEVSPGMCGYETVGLPDTAVRESRARVKSAIQNAGYSFPAERVIVTVNPVDVRKDAALLDLPIALGILQATGQAMIPFEKTLVFGELALTGTTRPIRGALVMALAARDAGVVRAIVPVANGNETAAVEGLDVLPAETLRNAVEALAGGVEPISVQSATAPVYPMNSVDISFVRGQATAKRALEIAAAGGHNLLMSGPPGTGKTLLARCLRDLLPDPTMAERMDISRIHSVAGLLTRGQLLDRRPFRAPHHTASTAALVGGGKISRPGEATLAHMGVLFLDELPEFSRAAREVLCRAAEQDQVTTGSWRSPVTMPARFQLVATMNSCPCGWSGVTDGSQQCRCSPAAIARYKARLSGPTLQSFDLHITCPRVPREQLLAASDGESTAQVRDRIIAARAFATQEHPDTPQTVARTIADLAGLVEILPEHEEEAVALAGD